MKKIAKFNTRELKDTRKLKSRNLVLISAVVSGETKLSPEDPFIDVEVSCLTSISCLTEHDKNEVYQSVNKDVPIGDLDCGIANASLCLACFVCYMFTMTIISIMLLQF